MFFRNRNCYQDTRFKIEFPVDLCDEQVEGKYTLPIMTQKLKKKKTTEVWWYLPIIRAQSSGESSWHGAWFVMDKLKLLGKGTIIM